VKARNEAELFKAALRAGIRYAEGRGVTDRRNGAGDDRHIGASFWQAERTSRWA
jgi:hypothetical protein